MAAKEDAGERYNIQVVVGDEIRWVELETCKLLHDNKVIFTIIINNITRRKKNEQQILDLNQSLEQKVLEWIQSGAEEFFQMLYRLDISEKKIKEVLHHEDIAKQIAQLIYERQIQKYNSRLVNKTSAEEKDKDLLW